MLRTNQEARKPMQTILLCNKIIPTLSPVCENSPAAACTILGKSLLFRTLEGLKEKGLSRFTVVLSKRCGELLAELEALKEIYDIKVLTSDSPDPQIIRRCWMGGEMLVIECDRNGTDDVQRLMEVHKSENSPLTFLVRSSEKKPFYISQKTSTEFSLQGVYIVSEELASTLPVDTKIKSVDELCQLNPQAVAVPSASENFSIRTPGDYLLANKIFLENAGKTSCKAYEMSQGFYNKSGKFLHGVTIIPPVFVGRNTRVGAGTVLDSFTVLGDNVTVGEGCYIKGTLIERNAAVGDNVKLEGAVLCKGAQLMKGAECEKMSVVGTQTVIGENTLVKHGVKIWGGKKISPSLTVSDEVRNTSDGQIVFDDEGAVTDINGFVTPAFAASLGMAVGSAVDPGQSVAVSFNGKKSGEIIASALAAGISSAGVNVWLIAEASRGELLFAGSETACTMGIEVSVDFKTCLRIFSKGGIKIPLPLEKRIEENLNFRSFRLSKPDDFGKITQGQAFKALYISRLEKNLPERFHGINVRVRTNDILVAKIADEIFRKRNDVNGEEIVFHINAAGEGISAYSEKTGYVFKEKLLLTAAKNQLSQGHNVALPETFPDAAEKVSENLSGGVFRYSLDSDGASDAASRKIAAEERNLFINDSLALCVEIVKIMQDKKLSLKGISKDLPEFYTTQRFVASSRGDAEFDSTEHVKSFESDAKAVLRPVKNGKGTLIYAQAQKAETATAFCDEIEKRLKMMND